MTRRTLYRKQSPPTIKAAPALVACLAVLLPFYDEDAHADCDPINCGYYTIVDETWRFQSGACQVEAHGTNNYCCNGQLSVPGGGICSDKLDIPPCQPDDTCTQTHPLGQIIQSTCDDPHPNCTGGQGGGGGPGEGDPFDWSCDGRNHDDPDGRPDEGCNVCTAEKDTAPLLYSSGRIQTNPIPVFSLPTPEDVPFGFIVRWGSHHTHQPTGPAGATTPPIKFAHQTNHFMGLGWLDVYSDKLFVHIPKSGTSIPVNPPTIDWQSFDVSKQFLYVDSNSGYGKYETISNDYELRDYGTGTSPRFRVIRLQALKVWEFSALQFTSAQGNPGMVGLLTKISVPNNIQTFAGGSYVTLARDAQGKLLTATDRYGREISFSHSTTSNRPLRIESVAFRPTAGATPVTVATLGYALDAPALRYIEVPPDRGATYYRFEYYEGEDPEDPEVCVDCRGLLLQLIVPTKTPVSSPPTGLAGLDEMVLEGHEFELTSTTRPRAVYTYGPTRELAYLYNTDCGSDCTRQLDLHLPEEPTRSCAAVCSAGHGCWPSTQGGDDMCYRKTDIVYDDETRQITSKTGTCTDCNSSFGYNSGGELEWMIDDAGAQSTFSWHPDGTFKCVIHNDDDLVPDQDPSNGCTTAQTGPYFTGQSIAMGQQHFPAILPGGTGLTATTTSDPQGRTLSISRVGSTRTIAGTVVQKTATVTTTYDSIGNITRTDGPLTNSVADDRVDYTYHSTPGNDQGRLYQVSEHVGTSASFTTLVTSFEQYDDEGVPRKITDPSGVVTLLSSTDRTTWTVSVGGSVSTYELNPDGTLRKAIDPDGVCITLQYGTSTSPTVAPTAIKWATDCGIIPIIQSTGDVLLIDYQDNEPERPILFRRLQEGTEKFRKSLTYNFRRRPATESSPHGTGTFNFSYLHDVLSTEQDPNCPGMLCGRTDHLTDALGRPTENRRFIDATNYIGTRLTYATGQHVLPTSIARGLGAVTANASSYVYDDFGRLAEAVTPDAGTTRFEYDAADRLVKFRQGVGTSVVRTAQISYDSVGRPTFIDHDMAHAVDCATSPAWTPITDEQYRYDSCDPSDLPSGFTCTNPMGRLTVARAILSCNANNAQLSRSSWMAYDEKGNIAATAIAFRDHLGVGSPEVANYAYSSGNRPTLVGNPIASYDTRYTYNAGRVSEVRTQSAGKLVAAEIQYQPFGPMRGYKVFGQLTSADFHILVTDGHALDYSPQTRTFVQNDPVSQYSISWAYDPAGYPALYTTDVPTGGASSRYDHDAAGRVTCEYGSGASSCPTGETSNDLRSRLTFFNGGSTTQPPDSREMYVQRFASYSPGISESLVYAASKNSPTFVSRTGGTSGMSFAHDPVGRRTSDEDSFDVASRRTYTYLPNGRLGTVTGQSGGQTYVFSITHDTDGLPVHVVKTVAATVTEEYDFYYNLAGDLRAARKIVSTGTPTTYRWSYDYLNGERIAAQREKVTATDTTAKRFIFENDFRGSPRRVTDRNGITYFGADYLASGWRNGLNYSVDMYVPFALAGQIVLEGTEATASGTYNFTRPPVHLNGQREHDPFLGTFLQPDPLDVFAREDAEGFVAMRANPLGSSDPTGLYTIHKSCRGRRGKGTGIYSLVEIENAMDSAIRQIWTCDARGCARAAAIRAGAVLAVARLWCPSAGTYVTAGHELSSSECGVTDHDWRPAVASDQESPAWWDAYNRALQRAIDPNGSAPPDKWALDINFNTSRQKCKKSDGRCLARTLAHEAFHLAGEGDEAETVKMSRCISCQ